MQLFVMFAFKVANEAVAIASINTTRVITGAFRALSKIVVTKVIFETGKNVSAVLFKTTSRMNASWRSQASSMQLKPV
jgi:hypothetical protein